MIEDSETGAEESPSNLAFQQEGTVAEPEGQDRESLETDLTEGDMDIWAKPESIDAGDLHGRTFHELLEIANRARIRTGSAKSKRHLVVDLLRGYCARNVPVFGEGIVEFTADHQAFLRWAKFNFLSAVDDVGIPSQLCRSLGLRAGQKLTCRLRLPRDKERSLMVSEVLALDGVQADQWVPPKHFDLLTAMFPKERIILEHGKWPGVSARVVDLIAPLGKGQRGLIVAPPRAGKTILLKNIARAIKAGSPNIHLILLLVDERPEEVTDFIREIDAEIYSSTFDENPQRHIQVSELVLERAKRLVEQQKDVVILLDSLTRLARGYNNMQPGKGRIMSGGVDAKALLKPKRFFGAARNVEEGGSLTILASALVETGSRMDEVIFEEFKGTGNMEVHLDRSLVGQRVYPAIHILKSGTRKDELLYHPQEFDRITTLRRQLVALPPAEAMQELIDGIQNTDNNAELLLSGLR